MVAAAGGGDEAVGEAKAGQQSGVVAVELGEFEHGVIDHAVKYVDGKIHTNGLENFWSLLLAHRPDFSVEIYRHRIRRSCRDAKGQNNRNPKRELPNHSGGCTG